MTTASDGGGGDDDDDDDDDVINSNLFSNCDYKNKQKQRQ
jgi:hypothetical protein